MKMSKNICIVLLLCCLASCANRGGGPQGGPRDSIPPVVVKESPANRTVGFTEKRVEVVFDEYIQLVDIQKNVLISPPQLNAPIVKAVGKMLTVEFQEDLQDSTTYTIDFGSAICDYNEKVPLPGYFYSFSTGDVIDSLTISGRVYDAETLNPIANIMVGIDANTADSAFTTMPFARIARTNADGWFTIHNVRPGKYRMYALDDISRDYMYQPGEALAFYDSLIVPYAEVRTQQDTIWRDTLAIDSLTLDTLFIRQIDSVHTHTQIVYLPDSLVICAFAETKQRHYFQGVYREEQHAFTLLFSAPQDSMPRIRALAPHECDSLRQDSVWINWADYAIQQTNHTRDTITYWLIDSLAIAQDSIYLEMQYLVSDSLYNLVQQTDTVLAVYRRPRMSEKAWETQQRQKRLRQLELKSNASSKFEIYDTLRIMSVYPLDSIDHSKIHLAHMVDTTRHVMNIQILEDSLEQILHVIAHLEPAEQYVLTIDSAAIYDIYGKCNDSTDYKLRVKSLDEYSTLLVKMEHFDARARLQILNEKDVVLREAPALEEGVSFLHLTPTTYYMRLYIDLNGDGKWTTGDWLTMRQPEPIYYYPSSLKLRANWDFEETIDHLAIPQYQSKPQALIGASSKKK